MKSRQALTRSIPGAAALIFWASMHSLPALAQPTRAPDYAKLELMQNDANSTPGARHVPEKNIPVPATVSPLMQEAIAAPYPMPLWTGDHPSNADEWKKVSRQLSALRVAGLPALREKLGVSMTPSTIGGVNAYTITPKTLPASHRNKIVMYIHGGGFVYNEGEAGVTEAMVMAAHGGFKVVSVDYRLAPDSPYPAALDDVVAAYKGLLKSYDPRRIAVAGTSAGGGLALALVLRAKAEGIPLPGAIAPGTPWADLTQEGGGDSMNTNEWVDGTLVSYRGYISGSARLYAKGHDLKDPLISPMYGDFRGFPPAIITTGTRDLFLSLSVLTHRKLRRAGVEAQLQVLEGQSHAQYYVAASAPETVETYREIALFFDKHLAR